MRRIAGVTAVLGLVLLSACGGSAASTGSAPPPTTARSATAAPVATSAPTTAPIPTVASTAPQATEADTPEPIETPGETQAAGETPAALDLCSLLTTAQVAAALKENVLDGAADGASCTWTSSDANGTTLLVIEQDTVDDFNGIRTITGGVYDVTTASGIGDDAYVSVTTGTNVATLYLRKGDTFIQVGVVDPAWSVDDVTTAEKTIAAEAVPGL